jgi:hypothetical protein
VNYETLQIEQGDINIVSHGGLALIGQAIQRYTHLSRELDTLIPLRHGTKHSDILKTYTAMLCLGKNDFEAINTLENALYFMTAMGLEELLSEPTLRQRMNKQAKNFLPFVEKASLGFLSNSQPTLTSVSTPAISRLMPMSRQWITAAVIKRAFPILIKIMMAMRPWPLIWDRKAIAWPLNDGKVNSTARKTLRLYCNVYSGTPVKSRISLYCSGLMGERCD